MMMKKMVGIIGCLGIIIVLASLGVLALGNPVDADSNQPRPVPAPTPLQAQSSAASKTAPTVVQSNPLPVPQPRPVPEPYTAQVIERAGTLGQPISSFGLPLLLIISTVVLTLGLVHKVCRHESSGGDYAQPSPWAKGMSS